MAPSPSEGLPIFANPTADAGAEICDGIDNDGNGIVDDVDLGGDGVCDCLRIATLGSPGGAGSGNVFNAWLQARSNQGATSLGAKVLTKEALAPYQVLIAQNLQAIGRTYSEAEVQVLADWIKNGGGFMTLIGYSDPSERENANRLLAPVGISYGAKPILAKTGPKTVPITQWTAHPVTEGVSRLGVDNGYAVLGQGTVLAREAGYDLLRAQSVGQGHALAWGDEWITFDSEWTRNADYQVERFWLNAIKWLTPSRQCQVKIPPR
jgi:hypothetical protein